MEGMYRERQVPHSTRAGSPEAELPLPEKKGRGHCAATGRPGARLQEDRGGRCQASVVARRSVGERAAWGLASLCVVVWWWGFQVERTHALPRFPSVLRSVICSFTYSQNSQLSKG